MRLAFWIFGGHSPYRCIPAKLHITDERKLFPSEVAACLWLKFDANMLAWFVDLKVGARREIPSKMQIKTVSSNPHFPFEAFFDTSAG